MTVYEKVSKEKRYKSKSIKYEMRSTTFQHWSQHGERPGFDIEGTGWKNSEGVLTQIISSAQYSNYYLFDRNKI